MATQRSLLRPLNYPVFVPFLVEVRCGVCIFYGLLTELDVSPDETCLRVVWLQMGLMKGNTTL